MNIINILFIPPKELHHKKTIYWSGLKWYVSDRSDCLFKDWLHISINHRHNVHNRVILLGCGAELNPPVVLQHASTASGKWTIKLSRQPPLPDCQGLPHTLILWENLPETRWGQTTQTKLQMQKAKKINRSKREHRKKLFFVWCNGWDQVSEQKLQSAVTLSRTDWTDLGQRRQWFWGKQTLCLSCPALWEVWPAPLGFWKPPWTPLPLRLSGGSQSRYLLNKHKHIMQDILSWRLL